LIARNPNLKLATVKFKILNFNNICFFLFSLLNSNNGFFYGENLNYGSYGDWVGANREPIKRLLK